jgi:hypothetical protein
MADAEKQLQGFIAKYSPDIAQTARKVRADLRQRMVGTIEMVYDNYNALVMAYSSTGKVGDVICSIALYPRWVSLFFMHGAKLKDPKKLLKGSGSTIRHIVLDDGIKTLNKVAVRDLLARAYYAQERMPVGRDAPETVIKSISAKQRPRRPDEPDRSKTPRAQPRSRRTPAAGRAPAARRTRAPRARTGR